MKADHDEATRRRFFTDWWDGLTRRLSRYSRVVVGGGVIAMILAWGAFVNRNENPEITARTSPAAWRIQPIGGGPTISFEFDQDSGWMRVSDSRSKGEELYFHDGRVIIKDDSALVGGEDATYVSVPIEEVFPAGMTFAPAALAPSLDRAPKVCTLPSSVEDGYVQLFLSSEVPKLAAAYTICGRSVFANGSGVDLIRAQDLSIESLSPPSAEEVVDVERIGAQGQALVDQLRRQIASPGGPLG